MQEQPESHSAPEPAPQALTGADGPPGATAEARSQAADGGRPVRERGTMQAVVGAGKAPEARTRRLQAPGQRLGEVGRRPPAVGLEHGGLGQSAHGLRGGA
jgi:hypothetical protein